MSAPANLVKRDEVIRFRAEPELKERLERIAKKRRMRSSEFLRTRLWELVQTEETALRAK